MKRVLALFLVLICMLSVVACDKATGSGEPVRDGDVSDISEIDKNVSSETEQTQQANVESISGTISHIDEDKICDLTEEEVKIIADIIGNGTWNTEGTADCANDCKLIIDERTYYYHSECGTFNCCCPHELSLTCLHESSSDCLTFCHQSLQGCRLTTGGNKDYVVMVPSISCSTTYLII